MRPEELFSCESFLETTQDGDTRSIPSIVALGETLVRKAIRADRQAVIKSVVTAMVNAKIASADDSLVDSASPVVPVVIDDGSQRRLGDD